MNTARRILYVDDDAGLRRLLQRAMERRGFSVVTAENAERALEILAGQSFDLIAVDQHMPGKNGLTLLGEIRSLPDAPPVVFVTGTDDMQVAVTALKSGAADFVVKTVGEDFFDLLANSFKQALERVALVQAKERVEGELREANARLQALLGEVNHRVANSLQLVSTFVTMQASKTKDPAAAEALAETQGRIEAIGHVHRKLYTSQNSEEIELHAYLEALLEGLQRSLSNHNAVIELALHAEPVSVNPDQAVSIGVIVTELVSNAAKYAFEPDTPGKIDINLHATGTGAFTIEVVDNGRGFQDEIKGTGLGMRIISAMARSLRSELERPEVHQGTRFVLAVEPATFS